MVKFNYNGSGLLSFSHNERDYIIHGEGPHFLPTESDLVISLLKQGLLTEVSEIKPESNLELNEVKPKNK